MNILGTLLAVTVVVLGYAIIFWRIFRRFRGDRFIECASVTTFLLAVVMALYRIPNVPSWVVKSILTLLVFFCWLSVYFGLQQVYRALRHRKTEQQGPD